MKLYELAHKIIFICCMCLLFVHRQAKCPSAASHAMTICVSVTYDWLGMYVCLYISKDFCFEPFLRVSLTLPSSACCYCYCYSDTHV